ncbi:beta-lactamase family protein [Pelagibius litoralis]|uniref:Beta-lactamase family protein n=1 Tax=Pelagibius litoralis TaxID=374515 RepID=A0A967EVS9_9PROT|nr:serine hydrolase domain-containing protein [Pelagibius litoralis]NIA69141.1 beta-lactamase family protein [Pelagibius litoralis]
MSLSSTHDTARSLQALVDRTVGNDQSIPGVILRVETPDFTWEGAAGYCDPRRGFVLRVDDAFHAASITKMFTATLCLQLAEEGLVDLDTGIGHYLEETLTDGLHIHDGRDHGASLTLRQLLSHTSGIADFFGDGPPDPDGKPPFVAEMAADPHRLWDPRKVIAWFKPRMAPRFAPGTGWHYSDTGFLLAGLVIEAVTGEPLHHAYRRRIFEPLGMAHSYLLYREEPRPVTPERGPANPFVGDTDYGSLRSTSADWGSGGLVVTAGDLARFLRAFADSGIFQQTQSRVQMQSWHPTGEAGVDYGLGLRRFDLTALGLPGFGELWGHTGFLKSFALYWPQGDAVICGTMNQSQTTGVFSDRRPVSPLVPATLTLLSPAPTVAHRSERAAGVVPFQVRAQ